MGAVFYLGAGWPQWKPLHIPGTHLPLKRGSCLNLVKCNLTKLTTTSLAVKRSIHELSGQAVHERSGQAVHKLSHQAAHKLRMHPAVNPISAGSRGTW